MRDLKGYLAGTWLDGKQLQRAPSIGHRPRFGIARKQTVGVICCGVADVSEVALES
jgi:hypothetical protein